MGQKTLWVSCKHPYVSTGHNIRAERGVNQNQNLALSVCVSYDPADLWSKKRGRWGLKEMSKGGKEHTKN